MSTEQQHTWQYLVMTAIWANCDKLTAGVLISVSLKRSR